MSDFRPSARAGATALGAKIETRDHPHGAKGASLSLDEVAKRIREGRLDPRVRAWAGKVLVDAGKPSDVIGQAQALLNAFRKQTMYAPDPVGAEYMVAAKNTLCLDDKGLCMVVADCDDSVIALGSAMMSIGIPIKVIGQSFNSSPVPSHVMLAIETKQGWKRIDPSSSTFDVGNYYPATKETWIDPIDTKPVSVLGDGPTGDFVGIGFVPSMVTVGVGVGHVVGIGEILSADDRAIVFNAATAQIQAALHTLDSSLRSLEVAVDQISQTRGLLRPDNPFDPEPAFAIGSLADFPVNGTWTHSMATVTSQMWDVGSRISVAAHEALNGGREILVDQQTKDVYIKAVDSDPWRLHTMLESATDEILGFFDGAGQLLSGFTSKDGKALSKEQIEQAIARRQTPGVQGVPVGVGAPQVVAIVIGVVVTVAIASAAAAYTIAKQCRAAEVAAKEATNKSVIDAITSGKLTPQQGEAVLNTVSKNRQIEARNDADQDPFGRTLGELGNVLKWMTIGGATAYGLFLAYPFLKSIANRAGSAPVRRRA